ncbi:MAG: hypothetical protein EXX96DRAFT_588317 [Benjaminiella poitrasii]|nr:MAG: hypothetical protein EXX96DRAFT_588317 [Benjaminiella poitrasii]
MFSTSGNYLNNAVKRPEFKEKFVEISEELFKGTIDSSKSNLFWDNYLILPVNVKCITQLIQSKSEEDLLDIRQNFKELFVACLDKLDLSEKDLLSSQSEKTRQLNSIALLTVIIRNLYSKKRLTHFNIISILTGLDEADTLFHRLVGVIQKLIQNPTTLSSALQLALVLSAGRDNVNQNGLNGYFMTNDMSIVLFNILVKENVSENDRRDIIMLLGMLSNYNKYESKNPYLSYIKKVKQKNALGDIIRMYTSLFISLRSRYIEINDDEEALSKTFVTYMSRWFSSSAPSAPSEDENAQILSSLPSAQVALMLSLFDLVNTNQHFINMLVTIIDEEKNKVEGTFLTSLLSFASYLFENNRSERTNIYSRLLLTIILRLTEENAVMNYMAKEGTAANVRLCRQRSPTLPLFKSERSLFCVILDDMLLFVRHNIRKKLDLSSYKLALSVIHRILCFLNKHKIRLEYHWIELWPTLTSTLHFTALRLDDIKYREDFNMYISVLISVFNICVTHGESFLKDTKSYDSLYYEIIRASEDFSKLSEHDDCSKQTRTNGVVRNERTQSIMLNEFQNIKLICNHFKPALDEWQVAKNIKFPTPEQVMFVINENYATLELLPLDKLDSYISFNEIPTEMGFFRQVLRVAVIDYLEYYTLSISST